ncbi:MAG: four helix bundle protein [Pyrinomonadaceae bacterium]|nr:four helix bundle protein [Pyrinomonadaceae bacterium]
MLNNSVVYEKAHSFAIRIVKAFKHLQKEQKEFVLSKQMLRSGTSIGANIAEANGAISDADFSNKISIAYKECLETKYWLSILKETDYINEKTFESIHKVADEIAKMLFSILKKTRLKNSQQKNDN